jgi:hypothetical protein
MPRPAPGPARPLFLQAALHAAPCLINTRRAHPTPSTALDAGAPPKAAANWVMGDIMAHCKEAKIGMEGLAMTPQVGGG